MKEMRKLKIELIEYKSSKLLGYLNMAKGFEIERIKKLETKLEKLKILKTIADAITESFISKNYLYHILKHKIIL